MTACAVAALTIYDMCKSADRSMVVEELCLWEKQEGAREFGDGRMSRPPRTSTNPLRRLTSVSCKVRTA